MKKARLFFLAILLLVSCQAFSQEVTCFIGKQQAEFPGMILAQEKGIYKKYGLNVKFASGGRGIAYSYLQRGKVMFTTLMLPTAIQSYTSRLPIVNLAQIMKSSSFMVVSKKQSGIKSIKDLNGKRIGILGEEQQIVGDAFIKYNNLNVTVVPRGASANLLLMDCVEALILRSYSEFHYIINSGIDSSSLTAFYYKDNQLNFPEDGLYCLESTYKANPELCKKFIRATLEGWQYMVDHPEESIDCVMKYVKSKSLTMNYSQMKWNVRSLLGLLNLDGKKHVSGQLNQKDYESTARLLEKLGLVKKAPPFNAINRSNQ
jgi:NitT/TauT family transport system substrate-binding protein